MKFLHTSDLHIGKVVNEFNMLEDQKHILKQIVSIAVEEKVDGVIIAGGIYDRPIPPADAVKVLDHFLTTLIDKGIKVLAINGNHDSSERLSFVNSLLEDKGLFLAATFQGDLKKVEMEDEFGQVFIYLMPYVKPQLVREFYQKPIDSYDKMVQVILEDTSINLNARNILVGHHFVTNGGKEPELSDSETQLRVGGADNVDASNFENFDYTALGHIHRPQKIGGKHVYYAGSPIKYSFSEVSHIKAVNIVELKEKGEIKVTKRQLSPLHDMRKIKGKLLDLIKEEVYSLGDVEDYISATLTNDEELIDPIGTLRSVYPNIMQIIIEKNITQTEVDKESSSRLKNKTTLELFEDFFELVTDRNVDEPRKQVMIDAMGKAGEV
ncbi:MAG: exonuclease SbcCD subunit D [Clostridiales bacterium]|nr:exonuclease SbcCD subunit D [Clostridiales bacterium]